MNLKKTEALWLDFRMRAQNAPKNANREKNLKLQLEFMK